MDITIYKKTVVQKNDFIFIKPLCDFFQIDYDNQVKKINSDPILKFDTSKKTDETIFGDKRERLAVSKRGFVRWIQLITPSKVHVSLRKKFEEFQISIFDYLYGAAMQKENIEKEIAYSYSRLKRLKTLYNKISNEIKAVQHSFNSNIEKVYLKIDFEKQLNS